jgi:hypothetical protein
MVMAHNFQGYDSYFIFQYLSENRIKYDVIMCGAKFLTLSVPMFKTKYIDSMNFIPMRLADFPKTFRIYFTYSTLMGKVTYVTGNPDI